MQQISKQINRAEKRHQMR